MPSARHITDAIPDWAEDPDAPAPRSIWDEPLDDERDLGVFADRRASATDGDPGAVWRAAEDAAWRPLLAAAQALARLDERLLGWPQGPRRAAVRRLALIQAADLAWAEGAALSPETLALDAAQRTGRTGDDDLALARAAWAARRLAALSWRTRDLVATDHASLAGREAGQGADAADARGRDAVASPGFDSDAGRAWAGAIGGLLRLHPVTAAAAAGLLWRQLVVDDGLSGFRRDVAVMKLASRAGRGGVPFAPLPRRRRLAPPDPAARLAALAGDVADGAETALSRLNDLAAWRVRADAAVADLSGRTAPLLVEALTGAVALSTNDLVAACAASKAAVCRNLAILTQRGVVREISGHTRYQVWAAAV